MSFVSPSSSRSLTLCSVDEVPDVRITVVYRSVTVAGWRSSGDSVSAMTPIAPKSVTKIPNPISHRAAWRVGVLPAPRSARGANTLRMSPNSQRSTLEVTVNSIAENAASPRVRPYRPLVQNFALHGTAVVASPAGGVLDGE